MINSSRVVARYLAARTIKLGSIGTYADLENYVPVLDVLDQVGIQQGDHYTITCDGCGAVTRCRCNGPRIEAHVPSCPECDPEAISTRYQAGFR